MQALAAVIFERTAEGAAKVNSDGDTLPRALRSVLLAVDGRSTFARYEPFLTSLRPLEEKFIALEQLGLLRRKGGADANAANFIQSPHVASKPQKAAVAASNNSAVQIEAESVPEPNIDTELQALSRQIGLNQNNTIGLATPSLLPDIQKKLVSLQTFANEAASTQAPRKLVAPSVPVATVTATALGCLLAEMEGFLSQTVGLNGLPVVIIVAQISSIEQLRRELPSYCELVRSYKLGAPAEVHIASLQKQLAHSH